MGTILVISSQVARGAVGLSVIVPVVQALGHTAIALPTILLSNHPGHRHASGQQIAPELLTRMLNALDDNGWLSSIDCVLTGYLPSPAHVAFAVAAVARVRRANPLCRFICDPVLGDDPKGLYIDVAAADALRASLMPLADVLVPNRFELAWLSGMDVTGISDADAAARRLGRAIIYVTSIVTASGRLATLRITATDVAACTVVRRTYAPNGTGDALAALIAGSASLGQAVGSVDYLLNASAGHDELQVTNMADAVSKTTAVAEVSLHDAL